MATTSLTDIIAAQRAYAAARSQAIEAARAPGADPKAAAQAQHQVLLRYLQDRVSLLTKARANALAQADLEIAQYQQKIGQVQQLLQADAPSPPPSPPLPPSPPPVPSTPAAPGSPGNRPTPAAPKPAQKATTTVDPKQGA